MITRSANLLAALSLAVLQPALAACQCQGCTAGCARDGVATAKQPSCCSATAEAGRTCCGKAEGKCPCGTCSDGEQSSDAGQSGAKGCLCSTAPQPTAVSVASPSVEHNFASHAPVADGLLFASSAPQLVEGLPLVDTAAPSRYGGLRIHAYLGVWLI